MKICIFGAGAIGGMIGSLLQNNGKEVLGFYWVFPTNRFKDVEYISDE